MAMTDNEMLKITKKAPAILEGILNRKADCVTGVSREDGSWRVRVEVLERRAVPDTQDILGTYEVTLKDNMDLVEYHRIGLRHRGDMEIDMDM
jgi:hypothetical protein